MAHIGVALRIDLAGSQANCSSNVTSILGGIRNAGTGLSDKEVTFIPGCSTTSCPETNFSDAASSAAKAKLAVVVLGLLGWDKQQDGPNADPNAFEHEGERISITDCFLSLHKDDKHRIVGIVGVLRARPYFDRTASEPVQTSCRPCEEQREDTPLVRDPLSSSISCALRTQSRKWGLAQHS